jgi:nicotinamidase-related amidase/ribosomal protein S18 acetylase RimI-like enzyme
MDCHDVALLLIDMQNEFAHPEGKLFVPGAPETVPRLAAVLAACREAGRPVLHAIRQHRPDGSDVETVHREAFQRLGGFCLPGSWGAEVIAELAPGPQEPIVARPGWSAFFDTPLHRQLRRLDVRTVIVAGTPTSGSVRATVYDATALGYAVVLLGDGTSSATPAIQEANLRDLAALGVPIVSCAECSAALRDSPPQRRRTAMLRPVWPEERAAFTQMAIETLGQGDLSVAAALRSPFLTWWMRRVMHLFFHRLSRPLVLEVDGETAGFLVLRRVKRSLSIDGLGVLAAFRQQGWGMWLLQQAEQEARAMGLARLELHVSSGNRPALALYARAGFHPVPRTWSGFQMERLLSAEKD